MELKRSFCAREIRLMPMSSRGLSAAMMRNPGSAATVPSLGTVSCFSDMAVMNTFVVSSGSRLNSST